MARKIIHITLVVASLFAGFTVLGFAVKNNQQTPCQAIYVDVDQSDGNEFISTDDIMKTIKGEFDDLVGKPISQGTLRKVSQLIHENPYVERAAVYRTIGGNLNIEIRQQQPMIRIINNRNQSYYLSETGEMLPVSSNYTARTMIATGNIKSGYSPSVHLGRVIDKQTLTDDILQLQELFQLAKAIDNHPFWKSMIDHIYVTNKGEFELTPINGAHIIEFGGIEDMDEKFQKLKLFYQAGLNQVGWNHYKRINLKYHQQVVCSK